MTRSTTRIGAPSKIIAWDAEDLRKLANERQSLKAFISSWIAADISQKFRQVQLEEPSTGKSEISSDKESP